MAAVGEEPGSKRRRLAAAIDDLRDDLRQLRVAERRANVAEHRRQPTNLGKRRTSVYVLLKLMGEYGVQPYMLQIVSKRLLPPLVWCVAGKPVGWMWGSELERRMATRRVEETAGIIWANRCAPENKRVMRKVKRLVAECAVFQNVVRANHRGIGPKRSELVSWMRKHWPRSDLGTDILIEQITDLRRQKRWSETFRRFWQVSWGKLPMRGALTLEDQSNKVFRVRFRHRVQEVPFFRHSFGTVFWNHLH